VQHILGDAASMGSAALIERLLLHAWPGNVRELDRVLREALARARSEGEPRIELRHLRDELRPGAVAPVDTFAPVREALVRCQGNVSRAAAELGMHRAQIYTMLRERGLRAESFR
jgi:transcriptional regulator of acetoin/glycerol metabolism